MLDHICEKLTEPSVKRVEVNFAMHHSQKSEMFISLSSTLLQQEDVKLVNATEREFMTALERTSELFCFKEFIRSRGEEITYRGPQSFLHRNDAARMSYRVQNSHNVRNKGSTHGLPQRTRFFECEEP